MKQPKFNGKVKWVATRGSTATLKEGRVYVGSVLKGLTEYFSRKTTYHAFVANPDPMHPSVEIGVADTIPEAKSMVMAWYRSRVRN